MKRLLCFLLVLLLLSGCAAPGNQGQSAAHAAGQHILVTMPTIGESNMTGLAEVQAAVNAITVPEIGVEVEFVNVAAQTSGTEYPKMITTGKQLDLMVLNNENIETYVSQKLLMPLDGLLETEGQAITALAGDYMRLFEEAELNGNIYAVRPTSECIGLCGGLWMDPTLLEEVSFPYEPEKIYSFEELDALFAKLKAAYPDAYPLGQITSNYPFSTMSFFMGMLPNGLDGGDPGVLEKGTMKIVDQYETPEVIRWLQYMRKWYLDGYIYPDSAITSISAIALCQSRISLSVPQSGTPFLISALGSDREAVCLRLSPIRFGRASSTSIFWTIPATSAQPEAAMRFLNLMFTDERIVNLLSWGIEGRDYTLDEQRNPVQNPGAKFVNPLGMYGDQRLRYEVDGDHRKAVRQAFSEQAVPRNPEYFGFRFDYTGLTTELTRIEQVKQEYLRLLECGCVDFDTVYPEFIEKLYDAGLQKVLDEKQKQFDIWRAKNAPKE